MRSSLRQPVVVELVAGVGEALAPRPADGRPPLGVERLRHEDVVVDRDDREAEPLEERREGVRAQRHARGAHARGGRPQADPPPVALEVEDGRALGEPHTRLEAGAPQTPRETRRVDHGAAVAVPEPAEVDRRLDLGAQLLAVDEDRRRSRSRAGARPLRGSPRPATARRRRAARRSVPSRSRCRGGRRPSSIASQVGEAEPVELGELVREAVLAVVGAVRERRHREPAVAPRGGPADARRLEQEDVGGRVPLLGEQRRPEAR